MVSRVLYHVASFYFSGWKITGVGKWLARLGGRFKSTPAWTAKAAETFFDGSRYSEKVQKQMSNASDIFHAFPPSVDGLASKYGRWKTKMGGDGNVYEWLEMRGGYEGKTGTFEYIKDSSGEINHRYFRPD